MTKPSISRFLIPLAMLFLAACQNGEPLAEAHGPWRVLNPGYWQPTQADLNPQIQVKQ